MRKSSGSSTGSNDTEPHHVIIATGNGEMVETGVRMFDPAMGIRFNPSKTLKLVYG